MSPPLQVVPLDLQGDTRGARPVMRCEDCARIRSEPPSSPYRDIAAVCRCAHECSNPVIQRPAGPRPVPARRDRIACLRPAEAVARRARHGRKQPASGQVLRRAKRNRAGAAQASPIPPLAWLRATGGVFRVDRPDSGYPAARPLPPPTGHFERLLETPQRIARIRTRGSAASHCKPDMIEASP